MRKFIEKEAAPYGDEMYTDAMGNLIVCKKGTGGDRAKKIMYAAHMDEIGFMVKTIEEDGRLRVCNLGWNWTSAAYNGRVQFKNGTATRMWWRPCWIAARRTGFLSSGKS